MRPDLRLGLSLLLLVTSLGWSPADPTEGALAAPAGFSDTVYASPGGQVTAFAFAPDGRLFITTQAGQLRVVQNGSLIGTPAVDFAAAWPARRLCSDFERGLLGVAVDPNFAANNYLYLFYTAVVTPTAVTACDSGAGRNSANVVNRVSRFTLSGNSLITTTEQVLVDNLRSLAGNHNGGDLNFGADGYLYITVGDSGTGGSLARQKGVLAGKLLRVNADGTPPAGNPFYAEAGARRCGQPGPANYNGTGTCQEVYAFGLRNPYRFAFDPNAVGTRFFINDVGQNLWEEIDLGQAGADYGWNLREGPCPYQGAYCDPATNTPSGYVDPVHAYRHDQVGNVITGGAFVPAGGNWPSAYAGAYLFADGGAGAIFRLSPDGAGGYTRTSFATGLGYVVHLRFGPGPGGPALYYSTGGQVRRLAYTVNSAPAASLTADPLSGAVPLNVTFSAAGSSDPDAGDTLTYDWNFGDGSAPQTTAGAAAAHTYTQAGVFTATLVVRDNRGGASSPATLVIQPGNTPPVPVLTQPAPGALFNVGQLIALAGSATDAQDGTLAGGRLSWEVRLHHVAASNPAAAHAHPFFSAAGAAAEFAAPAPEDLDAAALSYLEVRLTATDALGLSATVTRTVQPRRVTLTFTTQPAGLQVRVNELTLAGGGALTAWTGAGLALSAPTQSVAGQPYMLAPATLTAPAANTAYTLTFVPAQLTYLPIIGR